MNGGSGMDGRTDSQGRVYELAPDLPAAVAVRDSKDPDGPHVVLPVAS